MAATNLDPVLDALDRAPVGEEDLSPEELSEIERRAADLASGRVLGVAHADAMDALERLARKAG